MCRPASFVVTRNRVLWHLSSDRHEDIIDQYGLMDRAPVPDFVRVEVAPDDNKYLLPFEAWTYRVDQDKVPDWYSAKWAEEQARAELPGWKACRGWFFDAMEFVATIQATQWFKAVEPPDPAWRMFDTWAAARDAAWAAARDAARAAAGDAAWDAALLSRCLVVSDLIDPKHLAHARARWDVWRRGYGLLCDVDGVMYVYRKP